ncbi:alcohol dehydrogenase [Actinomadura rubrobrunea]|uniref:Alcohol dehydrogenase n=1 Tax=Actinomadura rubrobrunea TaxID=115335 RepID=A0A9W6PR16_9ACTN|nr:zinc-dependent dehydrogenase [Actinomadura rubrobrunea]GLW61905.1 alcohol dehydrogenase [Actinomadura rubrobrunea]
MKAARFHGPGDVRLDEVETPALQDGDVLVRVRAASICGTDLRILEHGHFKIPEGRPRVLGHEVSGDIVEVRGSVEGVAVGDRVAVAPNVGCGRCEMCRAGHNQMCPRYEAFGVSIDGGFQEYMRVPAFALRRGNVFRLPDEVGYADAALIEPFSCCYSGQRKLGVGCEDVVLIVGPGPIGAFHTMLARLAGARKIIVAGRSRARLEAVRGLGADVVVDVTAERLADVVMAETDGRGVDVAITAVSSAQVQAETVDLLAAHGRINFFSGLGGAEPPRIDTDRVHYKGLLLTGTTGASNVDYGRSLRLVRDRNLSLSSLVSATFPVGKIGDALAHAASGSGMKTMIVPDGAGLGDGRTPTGAK